MKITVKLFASFRDNRFKVQEREYPEGCAITQVMEDLGLTEEEMGVVLINSRHVDIETTLQNGDILALFPLVGGG